VCIVDSYLFNSDVSYQMQITVAARSEACTVFTLSISGVVVSNPIRDVDVCVYSSFVLFSVQLASWRRADPLS
jgi:hypothetical protein